MGLETPARIEPCLLEALPSALADVVAELASAASKLATRLHPTSAVSLTELVRVMNCYYSNLIEGHDTRPRDIQRALAHDLDANGPRHGRASSTVEGLADPLMQKIRYLDELIAELAKGKKMESILRRATGRAVHRGSTRQR